MITTRIETRIVNGVPTLVTVVTSEVAYVTTLVTNPLTGQQEPVLLLVP